MTSASSETTESVGVPFGEKVGLAEARAHLRKSGKEFSEYFTHGTLSVELYRPKGTDKQSPHDRDEIYVVASGRGIFRLGDSSTPFERGDVLFAPAGKEHCFTRFSADFSTWVFFYGPVKGEKGIVRNALHSQTRSSQMSTLKTVRNKASVAQFMKSVRDAGTRKDCSVLLSIMEEATGEKPVMWGSSIVGFGSYHYKGASGREGDWFITGFSPRKQNLTIYIIAGFDRFGSLMKKLGKYKTGKSCLYVNTLAEVDMPTLGKLISESVKVMRKK